MTQVVITQRDGSELSMTLESSISLMEAIRENGVTELLALCGGSCSCATCHVYIDPAFAGLVTPMNDSEDALLGSSEHRTGQSRLSCQIQVSGAMEGLRLRIAPED